MMQIFKTISLITTLICCGNAVDIQKKMESLCQDTIEFKTLVNNRIDTETFLAIIGDDLWTIELDTLKPIEVKPFAEAFKDPPQNVDGAMYDPGRNEFLFSANDKIITYEKGLTTEPKKKRKKDVFYWIFKQYDLAAPTDPFACVAIYYKSEAKTGGFVLNYEGKSNFKCHFSDAEGNRTYMTCETKKTLSAPGKLNDKGLEDDCKGLVAVNKENKWHVVIAHKDKFTTWIDDELYEEKTHSQVFDCVASFTVIGIVFGVVILVVLIIVIAVVVIVLIMSRKAKANEELTVDRTVATVAKPGKRA